MNRNVKEKLPDSFTRDGAIRLAATIKSYWLEKGINANVYVFNDYIRMDRNAQSAKHIFCIRLQCDSRGFPTEAKINDRHMEQ